MKRTTLLTAALAIAALIATATPAFAMRDPGPGGPMHGNGMGLYQYGPPVPGRAPTPAYMPVGPARTGMALYNYGVRRLAVAAALSRRPGIAAPPRIGQTGLNGQYRDGMSLYQYCRSNPVTRVDPSGLACTIRFKCQLSSQSMAGKCTRDCNYRCYELRRSDSMTGETTCDDVPKPMTITSSTQNVSWLCRVTKGLCGKPDACDNSYKTKRIFYETAADWGDCSRAACRKDCDDAHAIAKKACGKLKGAAKLACLGVAAVAHTTCRDACNAWCKKP